MDNNLKGQSQRPAKSRKLSKSIIVLIITLFFCYSQSLITQNNFQLLQEFDIEIKDFYTDKLQNIYLIRPDNEIIKEIPSLQQRFQFSNKVLDDLAFLDTNNPFNILLFYPSYNTILSLDRNMIETSRYNLFDLNLLQVGAVAISSDNFIWLYDDLTFKLKKVNNEGQVLVESADLSLQLNQSLRPNFLMEKEQRVYINDPAIGILIFDVFGQYIKTLDFKNLKSFQIRGEELLFFENQRLQSFHLQSLLIKNIALPEALQNADKIQVRKNRLYALEAGKLKIYSF